MANGIFIISLDFELNWGVHDVLPLTNYKENLLGVRESIPRLLELFKHYDIHATWAAVGLLFFKSKEEMKLELPNLRPSYEKRELSAYEILDSIGSNEKNDPYHFAASLIEQIMHSPNQELATHTFSHYYCLEKGQTEAEFEEDLSTALKIASKNKVEIKSIVFPRNQVNAKYLAICKRLGIQTYRGNERSFLFQQNDIMLNLGLFKRPLRLADSFMNITGHHIYSIKEIENEPLINLPSSRFLRPYNPRLKVFEPFRLKRIKQSLTYAAKEKKIYHLWWHPHNFGINIEENMHFLTEILDHFKSLKETFGMTSMNMEEIGQFISQQQGLPISEPKQKEYAHGNI